jgi:hypothetical protein
MIADITDGIEAKVRVAELHQQRGLIELEQAGWSGRCIATISSRSPRSRGPTPVRRR